MFIQLKYLYKKKIKTIVYIFQDKLDFKKWLEPVKNKDLYGISYPGVLIWSWKEQDKKMMPTFGWKCNM